MQLRNALILLGVAAGLVLFIALFERTAPSTDELREREKLAFPGFKADKDRADVIEIAKGSEKVVLVKRDPGGPEERWQITQPMDYGSESRGDRRAIEQGHATRVVAALG